jgi:transposase-like protein
MIPPYQQPKYPKEVKDKAFELYSECRSVPVVSKLTGIPSVTLHSWRKKSNWDKKIDKQDKKEVVSLDRPNPKFEKLCREMGLDDISIATLKEINAVSKLCMACILGNSEELVESVRLKPQTFREAVGALKTCWESKTKIFGQIKETKVVDQRKVDLIGQVNNYFGEGNADASNGKRADLSQPVGSGKALPQ